MAEFLLILESLICIISFPYILKQDKLFAFYYLFLFIYAIFAQIGYYYFSYLSDLLRAYFGTDAWYQATLFIILSLITLLVGFVYLRPKLLKIMRFSLTIKKRKSQRGLLPLVTLLILIMFLAYQATYLVSNWDVLSYGFIVNFEDTKSSPLLFIFLLNIKLSVSITFAIYATLCERQSILPKAIIISLLVTYLTLLLLACYKTGNTTDLLALLLGIVVYELDKQPSLNWKNFLNSILRLALYSVVIVFFALLLRYSRIEGNKNIYSSFIEVIAAQDFYPPAHILFAAVAYNYISPVEVLLSNISNSLVFLNYPLLQFPITELFSTGITTRSASYAFYILAEGYLVLGIFGFIYNSVVITFFLTFWRRLASTNSPSFNAFMLGLMGCMTINLVRGQSCYFFKYLYMFVLPGVLVYLSLGGFSSRLYMKL
jgi:hypothetical protein